ncbi:MAG: precorrin-6Y C5,15-methyltransferase (decarboxylating) subunit CbiT [Campylobacterota bacterium]|nr:precorrin-6Y C5,15-methyltransferase (decarboxylating) subunit CbiT [Campylobacterota bacterium]
MLSIIGNGMGDYDFSNIDIDLSKFDKIICDKNFKVEGEKVLKGGFKFAREYILENYDREDIAYVVTGSPFFFSAGILVANKLPKDKVKIINNTSSKVYMQERLFINDNDIDTFSLHGRVNIDLRKFLQNKYTFVVCDKFTIPKIKDAIKYLKPQDIEVSIGYKLGYKDEVIEQINLFDFSYRAFDMSEPYVLMIKKLFTPKPTVSADDDFVTQRGMITKQYKRHLSLQNLDLEPNQLLWDIGAGSGSCGIEAYKRYKVRTIFFEKQPQRVEFIKENLKNHKVLDSLLLEGDAEELFESLEENPQRIFVGGGGEKVIAKLPKLYERLDENGVMLINAITLKHLSLMINILNENEIKYEVFSLSMTAYKGKLDLVEPERQLFQIKVVRNLI